MNPLCARIEALLDELEAHPWIELGTCSFAPANAGQAQEVARAFGVTLGPQTMALYDAIDHVRWDWSLRPAYAARLGVPEDLPLTGSLRLLPLAQVLGGWRAARMVDDGTHARLSEGREVLETAWRDDLWFEARDAADSPRRTLHPVDYWDADDSGCVALVREGATLREDSLALHSVDYGVWSVGLDLDTYLDLTLETRGCALFARWSVAGFGGRPLSRPARYEIEQALFWKTLPEVFPAARWTELERALR